MLHSVLSMESALVDSNALAEAAREAGITLAQARKLFVALSPEVTARLANRAHQERVRAANRGLR